MERKKYRIIILLLCMQQVLSASSVKGTEIYEAYVSGSMDVWKNILIEMRQHTPKSNAYRMEEVNYQYGYIGWCIGTERKEEAKLWMERMEKNLVTLEKTKYAPSMTATYRGSLIGFRIGLNKLQAPFIGQKSVDYAKSAMKSDPTNPLAYLLYGNILYYTPGLFGGSREEAMKHYLKALKKMESQPVWLQNNWNYLNLLTVIATAYHAYGQQEKALLYLNKALNAAPEFSWVKNELYPTFLKD